MNKLVIIMNGTGGAGKDTLCRFAAMQFQTRTISSITPIKEIAAKYGEWDGQKDAKSRKFLADLKQLFVDYNDLPFRYLCRQYQEFLDSSEELLFVQIREAEEIEKFRKSVQIPCITLLIVRADAPITAWGNSADDQVSQYHYDYTYSNHKPLQDACPDFCSFLRQIITTFHQKQ